MKFKMPINRMINKIKHIINISFILFAISVVFGFTLDKKSNWVTDPGFIDNKTDKSDSTRVVTVRSTGMNLTFEPAEMRAIAGESLTVRYVNDGDMTHNILFLYSEDDIRPVGIASAQYHNDEWVPKSEIDRIFAYSELAWAGETVEVTFIVPEPGIYPFICTYAMHWTSMQGRLISEE
jgi:plastocyanin